METFSPCAGLGRKWVGGGWQYWQNIITFVVSLKQIGWSLVISIFYVIRVYISLICRCSWSKILETLRGAIIGIPAYNSPHNHLLPLPLTSYQASRCSLTVPHKNSSSLPLSLTINHQQHSVTVIHEQIDFNFGYLFMSYVIGVYVLNSNFAKVVNCVLNMMKILVMIIATSMRIQQF